MLSFNYSTDEPHLKMIYVCIDGLYHLGLNLGEQMDKYLLCSLLLRGYVPESSKQTGF